MPSRTKLATNHGGGGCAHVLHGRFRMTIDRRIPAMTGRSTSGIHRPGRRCLRQATKCREVLGELQEGCAASSNTALVRRTFLLMDDSVDPLVCLLMRQLPSKAMGILRSCLVGTLPCTSTHFVTLYKSPCAELTFSTTRKGPNSTASHDDRRKQKKISEKRVPRLSTQPTQ